MGSEGNHRSRAATAPRAATRQLVVVGANHRTCSIDGREALLRRATYPRIRRAGGAAPPWDDLVLLTTCNRIEAYVVTADRAGAVRVLRTAFQVPDEAGRLYVLSGVDAAAHLLRVASGLDSLAQGESQIAAQVRGAASRRPRTWPRSDDLAALLDRAAHAASRIRRAAALRDSEASASHAALRFIESSVHLPRPTVALLGTGKMARIAAESLRGRARIFVANRDPRRAREVARALGGRGASLDALNQILGQADVVLAATASGRPLVSAARLRRVLARRPDRPLWIIDLGFPRNVAPACRGLSGVTLIDLDGLAPWGARPLPPAALARAEAHVRAEAERLARALRPSAAEEVAFLRRGAEAIRRREVAEALARLPALSEADRAVVDKLATRLVNRFLHGPTEVLRSSPEAVRAELAQGLLRGLGEAPR